MNQPDRHNTLVEKLKSEKAVVAQTIGQLNINTEMRSSVSHGPLFTVPQLPATFVNRSQEFNQLTQLLLDQTHPSRLNRLIALQGGGGFGKTVLAQAVCYAPQIRRAFPEAILWLELGQEPKLLDLVMNQIRLFDRQPANFTDVNVAAAHLRQLLANRQVLLVLDDVWEEAHALPFLTDNPRSAVLLTTRRRDVTARLCAWPIEIDEMATEEATALLLNWLADPPADRQPFYNLARYLGEWPLLLDLAAAYLRELVNIDYLTIEEALAELWEALALEGVVAFDRADEGRRNRAVSLSLDMSLKRLAEWRPRYLELAVFPQDVDIPLTTIERLWQQTANLSPRQTKKACRAMQRLSLFNRYDSQRQTVRLHSVIHSYLRQQQTQPLGVLHNQLLEAHLPLIPTADGQPTVRRWTELPPDEPYLWDYLVYHLGESQPGAALLTTVLDLGFLAHKIYHRNVYAAELDLLAAETYLAQLPEATQGTVSHQLRLLRRLLANMGQLLNEQTDLPTVMTTLYSRLYHIPELTGLVEPLAASLKPPYFAPRHPLPNLPHPALQRTLIGHTLAVTRAAFSPNGRYLLSASLDSTLKIWQEQTGQEMLTLKGHQGPVMAGLFSPDGLHILSASWDRTLKLWDVPTGLELLTFRGHTDRVQDCAYHPAGDRFVSASEDQTLKIWQVDTGQCLLTLTGHPAPVNSCVYSPDGQYILSAADDQTLKIWQADTGHEIRTLRGHTGPVLAGAYHPSGRWVVSASADKTLIVWSVADGEPLFKLEGHQDIITSCAFSPDGQLIMSTSYDRTLKLWSAENGNLVACLTGHTDWVRAGAYSPNGKRLLSAASDESLKIWQVTVDATTSPQPGPRGHAGAVHRGAYQVDLGQVVTASDDHTLKLWHGETGQEGLTLRGHTRPVHGCCFSPDGRQLCSASWDRTLNVWATATGEATLTLTGHQAGVENCAYSPTGDQIVSASADQTLRVWQASTGEHLTTLRGHEAVVFDCAYHPDGQQIVSASGDYTLKVWSVAAAECLMTLTGHSRPVNSCTYSPDGRQILSAADDRTLKIWQAETGQSLQTLTGHHHWVTSGVFSPDGRYILSTSADCTVKLWDAVTGQCLTTLALDGALYDGFFTADGQQVVVVGSGGVYFLRLVLP